MVQPQIRIHERRSLIAHAIQPVIPDPKPWRIAGLSAHFRTKFARRAKRFRQNDVGMDIYDACSMKCQAWVPSLLIYSISI